MSAFDGRRRAPPTLPISSKLHFTAHFIATISLNLTTFNFRPFMYVNLAEAYVRRRRAVPPDM